MAVKFSFSDSNYFIEVETGIALNLNHIARVQISLVDPWVGITMIYGKEEWFKYKNRESAELVYNRIKSAVVCT